MWMKRFLSMCPVALLPMASYAQSGLPPERPVASPLLAALGSLETSFGRSPGGNDAEQDRTFVAAADATAVRVKFKDALSPVSPVNFEVLPDGFGEAVVAEDGKASCVVRIRPAESSVAARIRVMCAPFVTPWPGAIAAPVASASLRISPFSHQIEYEVTGSARLVLVTSRNEEGGTEQHVEAVPYRRSFAAQRGAFVYLSAQKQAADGEINVSITVDGRSLQKASASSPYGIATASGSVP